ncbi:Cholinesterase [Holothuria leucospilota]|uniref:Cholinesterase n=1 Tax=Holothuria leucospilota TaxID=206669 RepID=A0A9Q1C0N4_HOLLE|nr:Cholinesterase [Holothuria leucospilota]
MSSYGCILAELIVVALASNTVYATPYVTIQHGRLFGETVDFQEDGIDAQVDVFKGIPFAEIPVRFHPPEPKKAWTGDWNATYYRYACMQPFTDPWRPWYTPTISEDCLYLNVYAPHPKLSNVPVMVYIHGGSYNTGTAMVDDHSGIPLAGFEQVIVVVINYRLNVFGFLSTAFGGNNESVTIFGESAGAGSVDFHRFSKYSRDLFDRAILQSGAAMAPWSFRNDPELEREQSLSLGMALGCETENTTRLVECLRNVSADKLHEAHLESGHIWTPSLDGVFLDESPDVLLHGGDFKESPILIGFNKDEGTLTVPIYYPDYINSEDPPFIDRDNFDFMTSDVLRSTLDFTNELTENAVKQEYIDWSQANNSSADFFLTFLPIYGDSAFSCPAVDIIRAHSRSTQPVFQYFFTHVPHTSYFERGDMGTGWFLSGHCEDLPFVFGWGFIPDLKDHHFMSADEKKLSRKMMRFWANFARTGDPSKMLSSDPLGTGEMEWPRYSAPDLLYKELSLNMTMGRGIKADECSLWNGFLKELEMYLVQQGRLFGETIDFNEDGKSTLLDVFKGIPYAEPPKRFSVPEPKGAWAGDWNATYYRPSCMQSQKDPWRIWYRPTISEDCLFLNIFAPNPKPANASVMVYIHGGSYVAGSGNVEDYSGISLAAFEDVIVVVINYRLNVFGFLSTGDDSSRGNYGFFDQAEALKWIRANIEAFGGNKTSVTIFGESAGAGSVDFLRLSRYSWNLFDRAILQSGTAMAAWSYRSNPPLEMEDAFALGKSLNCVTSDTVELVECLKDITAENLLSAYLKGNSTMAPNLDGVFLHDHPHKLIARGDFKQCPIIVGFNKDEGTLIMPFFFPDYVNRKHPPYVSRENSEFMRERIFRFPGEFTERLIEDTVDQKCLDLSANGNSSTDHFSTFLPIYGDFSFTCPAMDIIRAHFRTSEPVFQYYMTHVPKTSYYEYDDEGTGWFLCGHIEDIPFVFGWAFNSELKDHHYMSAEEKKLSRKIMRFWANFAKTGDPSKTSPKDSPGTGEMEWPVFSETGKLYKELSIDLPVKKGHSFEDCAPWTEYISGVGRSSDSTEVVNLGKFEDNAISFNWSNWFLQYSMISP